jgi:hypothetical protein
LVGVSPEMEIAAAIVDEYPGLPLSPGSSERHALSSEVMAPAEAPAMAMRVGSIR